MDEYGFQGCNEPISTYTPGNLELPVDTTLEMLKPRVTFGVYPEILASCQPITIKIISS